LLATFQAKTLTFSGTCADHKVFQTYLPSDDVQLPPISPHCQPIGTSDREDTGFLKIPSYIVLAAMPRKFNLEYFFNVACIEKSSYKGFVP
jgi:hypothetical protein